jgi:hypothetical protein
MAVEKKAPQGYVGTPEAARPLGVTQQTIRNRIRAKTLQGKDVRYPDGERRYYVERSSLDLELSRRGQVARYENIAEYSQTLADHFTRQTEMLRDAQAPRRHGAQPEGNSRQTQRGRRHTARVSRLRETISGRRTRPLRPLHVAGSRRLSHPA